MSQDAFLWFEAHTGRVFHADPSGIPSNYHRYRLPRSALYRIMLAVGKATPGAGGLEYDSEFLSWLASMSQEAR